MRGRARPAEARIVALLPVPLVAQSESLDERLSVTPG
jgi:hypothetical protein